MKQKTTKILARVICLILAVVLALTMLAPMMSLMAFATDIIPDADAGVSVVNTSTIRKDQERSFVFTITDPEIKREGVKGNQLDGVKVAYFDPTSAFSYVDTLESVLVGGSNDGLATFSVPIKLKYSGYGSNVSFYISYILVDGTTRHLSCNAVISNTEYYDEKEEEEEDEEDDIDPDPLTPHIIVETYSHGGAEAIAGENFTLELLLRNTSEDQDLENIVINVAPQGVFSMGSASNTIYIDEIFAGNTTRQEIIINTGLTKVTDDEDANSINMSFSFQYLVENVRKSGTSNEIITVPVTFPDRFELSPPELDSMSFTGEEAYVYLPLANKGRSSVYNVSAMIRGEGITNPGQTQFIGNISAGSSEGADFAILYEEPGEYTGEVVVTYEDTNMNPKEAVMPFSISVNSMEGYYGGGFEEEDFMDPTLPTGPVEPIVKLNETVKKAMLIVGSVIALIAAYITIKKAKIKQSILSDEEF